MKGLSLVSKAPRQGCLAALSGNKTGGESQVWSADITYIPMRKGFLYLGAIIDWYSRKALSWRIFATMDADFCIDAFEEALTRYGTPERFNTDQGSQFTRTAFTNTLQSQGYSYFHGWSWPVAG